MKGIIRIGFKVSKWGQGVFLNNNTIFFIVGKVIAKGCSAVVYTAKQVEQKVRTWQTNNNNRQVFMITPTAMRLI